MYKSDEFSFLVSTENFLVNLRGNQKFKLNLTAQSACILVSQKFRAYGNHI